MEMNPEICFKRNTHNRTEAEIKKYITSWAKTPEQYIKLDYSLLLEQQEKDEKAKNEENTMENVTEIENVEMEDAFNELEEPPLMENNDDVVKSKDDVDGDNEEVKILY